MQLDVYAIAAVDVWSEDPAALRTTYCYLDADGTFHLAASEWTPDRVAAARDDLAAHPSAPRRRRLAGHTRGLVPPV